MTQNHSIEAILTAKDQGFSTALNNALNLIHSVTNATGMLTEATTAVDDLRSKATTLGDAFERARVPLAEIAGVLKTKVPALRAVGDAQTAFSAALSKSTIVTKGATIAKKGLAVAMNAIPIFAVISAIVLLISSFSSLLNVGKRIINFFRRSREAATENGDTISDLADKYNRSAEEIQADMERMGTTCLDVWEAQEKGIISLAEEMGVSTDQIRSDMEQMGITCIDVFKAQKESIQELSDVWNVCGDQIRDEIVGLVGSPTDGHVRRHCRRMGHVPTVPFPKRGSTVASLCGCLPCSLPALSSSPPVVVFRRSRL